MKISSSSSSSSSSNNSSNSSINDNNSNILEDTSFKDTNKFVKLYLLCRYGYYLELHTVQYIDTLSVMESYRQG